METSNAILDKSTSIDKGPFQLSLHHLFHPQLSPASHIFNFLSLLYPPRFIISINSNRLGTLSTFPSSSISPSTLRVLRDFQLSFTPLPSTLYFPSQLLH